MRKRFPSEQAAALAVASFAMALLVFSGCETGGGGSSPDGTATVQGNISSFTTSTARFLPAARSRGLERIVAGLADLLVPSAYAGVGGVGVRMMDTDLQTTTDSDGFFIMSGVPSGEHRMQFSYNGSEAYLSITVPDGGTVTVSDIQCQGAQARAGRMNVRMGAAMNASAGTNSGGMHGGGMRSPP